MKFNPLDIFIDITEGFDRLWAEHKKLCYGLCLIAFVLMMVGVITAEYYPFATGVAVCLGSIVAAYFIGRES